MTAPLSAGALERIDEACDAYEAAWKAGGQPGLDEYLHGEAGPEREALQRELLRVQAYYQRADQCVTVAGVNRVPPRNREQPFVTGYEILRELGRGGMGVVYLARQARPNRLVALKMISAGAHAGPREIERFRREADAVAQLQDPNIVQVYEVGEQGGQPYFALEYVEGGSLDQYLAGTPLAPQAAALLVERLAGAMHHAHQRGIVHRDLKPANVLLSGRASSRKGQEADGNSPPAPNGSRLAQDNDLMPLTGAGSPRMPLTGAGSPVPKITDFGLAKLLDGSGANPTRTGDLLGTPSYMAPEQVGGKSAEINAATDIYGLGAILYECLTGRPPFRGESPIETMLQVQSVEPVSPTRLQPRCPRDLATICLKCLSKLPSQRYASAAELADDLRRFQEGQPIRARPIGPLRQVLKWTRRQPTIAALAALLLLAITLGVGTGSWFWWQAELGKKKAEDALFLEGEAKAAREATLDRYRVALAHREWLANNVGPAGRLLDSCSADQRQSWEWRYLDRMRDSALHVLKGHTNTVQALAVHPSGQKFVSGSHDTELREWDLPSGRSRVLGSHKPSAVLAVAYSPDGRLLASSDSHHGRVQLRDAETDQVLRVLTFGGKGEIQLWGLAFDPTSRYLAVGGFRRLRVWDTHDQTWTAFEVADSGQIYKVAFSRDGRYLATASKEVKVWDWPARAKQPLSVWPGHGAATYDLAFSPDSGWLVSGGRDGLVRVRSLQPPQQEFTLNASPLSVTSVAFSPDGHRLATSGQDGDMHVWDVKTRRRLFTLHGHSGAVWDLEYTPDGTRLLSAGSDFVVNVWDASTGQEVTHLPASPVGVVRALGYGPEGRILAWGDNRGRVILWDTARNKEILRRDVPGQGDRAPIVSFAFSPNGGQVAWHRANAPPTLWDIDSAKEIPLPGAGPGSILGLAFFAEGKQLLAAYRVREGLRLCDLRTGRDLLTLARPNLPITQVIWSADTTFFVTVEDRKHVRVWDMATGQLRLEREYPPSVTFVTLSHDARFLAVGGVAGKVRVWDLKTNRETMAVTGHASNVSGLALTPDGHRLASSASDSTVKLWDTQTGNEVLTLRTQLHEHSPLAFSPDGADLASVNTDSRLQIWTTRTARRNP